MEEMKGVEVPLGELGADLSSSPLEDFDSVVLLRDRGASFDAA